MTGNVYRIARVAVLCLVFVSVTSIMAIGGCASDDAATTQSATVSAGEIALCTGCGQIKGSEECCADGATLCACGMVKGSPGCCRIEQGSSDPVALCATCGHIKGDEMCCKPGQEMCSACDMVKGSAGCCKIK